jgi:hypothetical protein
MAGAHAGKTVLERRIDLRAVVSRVPAQMGYHHQLCSLDGSGSSETALVSFSGILAALKETEHGIDNYPYLPSHRRPLQPVESIY